MDYDVAAASLTSPTASAPVQSYRPSVAVQNLGIHPATVTGTLRIYDRDAGTLLDTMALASTDVPVGATRNALADKLWEPVPGDIGKAFLFIASVNWPPDQNLANNNLGPITVTVTAAPPPPPPPVTAHASQHENGGADEVSLEGLTGKAAERQDPSEHASQHEEGGEDQLSVAGLAGKLADAQDPTVHAPTHAVGGSDPVTGTFPGEHGASQHDATVEATANKGAASGYAPLDTGKRLPIARLPAGPVVFHSSYEGGISDHINPGTNVLAVEQDITGTIADATQVSLLITIDGYIYSDDASIIGGDPGFQVRALDGGGQVIATSGPYRQTIVQPGQHLSQQFSCTMSVPDPTDIAKLEVWADNTLDVSLHIKLWYLHVWKGVQGTPPS